MSKKRCMDNTTDVETSIPKSVIAVDMGDMRDHNLLPSHDHENRGHRMAKCPSAPQFPTSDTHATRQDRVTTCGQW